MISSICHLHTIALTYFNYKDIKLICTMKKGVLQILGAQFIWFFPPSCNLVHIQYFFLFLFLKSDILLKYSPWKTFQKFVQIKAPRKVKSSAETTLAVCCTPDFPKVYWSESSLHADCMSHLYKQGAVCQLQDIMEENPEDRHQTDHTYRLIGLPRPKSYQLVLV